MTDGPASIGIILDGNRRFAKERGLPPLEGHRRGFEKVKEVMEWAREAGVREVTLYAFSTENWNRAPEEVGYLMELFADGFREYLGEVIEKNIRLRFLGERSRLSEKLRKLMEDAETRSAANTDGTLAIALSYGGRAEILDAVNSVLAQGDYEQITEEELRAHMWSAGMGDPDIIIRTSGEHRLSGFLTWQSVYSELFFIDTYWPALTREEFDGVLAAYRARERRHGK